MAVQINARGEAELRDRIRRAARLADLSMNDWILRALESALGGAEESEHSPSDRSVAASSRTSANGAPESASPVPSPRASTPSTATRQGRPSPAASTRAPKPSLAMQRQERLNADRAKGKRG